MPPTKTTSEHPVGRVLLAQVYPTSLTEADWSDELRSSAVPGTRIERHRRVWRMGQVREDSGFLMGRIGFEKGTMTERWNEARAAFEEAAAIAGTTSPFAIRLEDGLIAFQRRPGEIKMKTFTGALQALINEASEQVTWRVEGFTYERDWSTWVGSVAAVTNLEVTLRRPNPHYSDRKNIKAIMEGAEAELAKLKLQAASDDGIAMEDEFVRQSIEHVQAGYGTLKAVGKDQGGEVTSWKDGTMSPPESTIDADPTTREVPAERLRDELQGKDAI